MPYARSIGLTLLAGSKNGPAGIPNLELWLRSDSGIGLTAGGLVASWADISGHAPARNALQATAGNQPGFTAVDANFNNRPSLNFNGATNNRFLAGSLPLPQPAGGQSFTMMTVAKMTVANQSGGIFDSSTVAGTTNTAYMMLQNGSTPRSFRYPAANDLQYTLASTSVVVNFARSTLTGVNAETKEIFEKAVSKGTQAQASVALQITQYRVGRLFQDVFPFQGDIAEIACWSRALTNAQIAGLSAYATALYAIP